MIGDEARHGPSRSVAIIILEEGGQTAIAVAAGGRLLGLVGIADVIKEDAAEAIARLRDAGLTPVMLTGDNERTARAVAAQVGIEQVLAQVLPDAKAERFRALQAHPLPSVNRWSRVSGWRGEVQSCANLDAAAQVRPERRQGRKV